MSIRSERMHERLRCVNEVAAAIKHSEATVVIVDVGVAACSIGKVFDGANVGGFGLTDR